MGDGHWSPIEAELDPVEWQSTVDWLSRGNALVIVTTVPKELPRTLQENLGISSFEEAAAERIPFFDETSVPSRPETAQTPVAGGPILEFAATGPRWHSASSPVPAPASGGGSTSSSGAPPTNATPPAQAANPAQWQLAGDARGGLLFRFPIGKGSVYILLDDFAWTNAGFDHSDNARILADLLSREVQGGVLAFDEYRHGHGRTESFLVYLFQLPGAVAVFWLGTIWALFFAYGRNVRLRQAEAYVERERRTAQEYIDAVAQLYERARAAPLVVEAAARRLRQVARSSAECPRSVEILLQRADDYVKRQDRPAAPTAAIQLTRELIQLRKAIYGTRTVS
jgi:hypothetical protein